MGDSDVGGSRLPCEPSEEGKFLPRGVLGVGPQGYVDCLRCGHGLGERRFRLDLLRQTV